jgi:hypothetical protein
MEKLPKFLWLLAIVLLLVATARLPYGYYTLLRITVAGFCGLVAYLAWQEDSRVWATAFGLITVVFNPIIPVYFDRGIWLWLDVGAATIVAAHLACRYRLERLPRRTK